MKKKNKIKAIALILIAVLVFSGCSHKSAEENTEIKKESYEPTEDQKEKGHITVEIENGAYARFRTIPQYFQQDYTDVSYGKDTIALSGNMVTCLSMIDSYYSSQFINPEKFLDKYSNYINEDGITDEAALISEIGQSMHLNVKPETLDVKRLARYLTVYQVPVLLKIEHPSIYGRYSACMLITGVTDNGDFIVRDPDMSNYSSSNTNDKGEMIYSNFDLIAEAGNTAVIYPFITDAMDQDTDESLNKNDISDLEEGN